MRCLGHSFNCYSPYVLGLSRPMDYNAALWTLCADASTGAGTSDATIRERAQLERESNGTNVGKLHPSVVHFATISKPWLPPATPTTPFYVLWWERERRAVLRTLGLRR